MVVYYVRREEGADMLTMTREPDVQTGVLLKDFLAWDAHSPEGYRAELIDGEMVVSPPPAGNHEVNVSAIVEQVVLKSAATMDFSAHKGLIVPSFGQGDEGRVIPDLTLAPRELKLFRGAPPWMEVAGVEMVVEVTSSRPDLDREAKRRAYAAAGIPLYLLADRKLSKVILFSDPKGGDYSRMEGALFGEDLPLPAPFSFALDTSDFAD
jgi:Uma2 family endonuclease